MFVYIFFTTRQGKNILLQEVTLNAMQKNQSPYTKPEVVILLLQPACVIAASESTELQNLIIEEEEW